MVHSMIGDPVPWPSAKELERFCKTAAEIEGKAEAVDWGELDEDEEQEEYELERWENDEMFGIQKPLIAIGDQPTFELMPLQDLGIGRGELICRHMSNRGCGGPRRRCEYGGCDQG
eukprot:NODE_15115_length_1067_cov_4.098936.p2 GENE.NODE_15115_length_1067_cov_4.098936~~NODE_15115_length_1067_cov_4.098936.p2  ORF type:complete len:116 (+),score=14.88 NODE_15115_length_1067_cov_4.098936:684-1031(+)